MQSSSALRIVREIKLVQGNAETQSKRKVGTLQRTHHVRAESIGIETCQSLTVIATDRFLARRKPLKGYPVPTVGAGTLLALVSKLCDSLLRALGRVALALETGGVLGSVSLAGAGTSSLCVHSGSVHFRYIALPYRPSKGITFK
jgi:hypothetical protein